ncbi:VUT family protein [Novacetimonas pomaceti]|uniref:Beta-carotene 15,15'-monooxygenase n=1 Tax=Novacetimonas pomaceti TaxID=2021998 RepID=A0ABX5P680_9PROT|nr:VUT family protein [Novacetimonas pomaceti]PYD48258.1 beta-carotene 15,15'-monooxygenase [Novacetimonas pomaceti]
MPLANWLINNVGTICAPHAPCLLPVAPGLMAPSGVLMVGVALILRDLVQRRLGLSWSVMAIAVGALFSALFAAPSLVLASTVAFAVSETVDLLIYTPLQKRNFVVAAFLSGIGSVFIDSMAFLMLAFGNLDLLFGQVIGKTWMIILALPLLHWLRKRDRMMGMQPA